MAQESMNMAPNAGQLERIDELAADFDPNLVGYAPADAGEAAALISSLEDVEQRFNAGYDAWYEGRR